MSAKLLRGAPVAAALAEKAANDCAELMQRGITPCLAVIRVGERADDISYEKGLTKRCAAAGIDVRRYLLEETVSQQELMDKLTDLNENDSIHGILIFLPLPAHLDARAVRRHIAPEKDMDDISGSFMAGLCSGTGLGYAPCTAQAVIEVLKFYKIPLSGAKAVVMGRSPVVGKPAAMLLLQEDATVTVCHSRSRDVPALCREADVLVVAAGKAKAVGPEYLAAGQTVIDVGIHADENGGLCGDVDTAAAEAIVDAVSPVPGGLGAVTTAVLVSHVTEAARRSMK